MKRIIEFILALPKSIYINFKCFNFRTACKMPIVVSNRVHLKGVKKGSIIIEEKYLKPGMIRLGISDGYCEKGKYLKSFLSFATDSCIHIVGITHIANNFTINMCPGGILVLGNNFSSNYGLVISCEKGISFGNDCLLGWKCVFIDGDGHDVFDSNQNKLNTAKGIIIGNHVWISAQTTFLKGTKISDNSVVGFGSLCLKEYEDSNCLLVGIPAKVRKRNINWKC